MSSATASTRADAHASGRRRRPGRLRRLLGEIGMILIGLAFAFPFYVFLSISL